MGRSPSYVTPLGLMPIISEKHEIVGWSRDVPEYKNGRLRHQLAEKLIGDFRPCYVEVQSAELAKRAGAPDGWQGPWRCLAICSTKAIKSATDDVPTFRFVGRKDDKQT